MGKSKVRLQDRHRTVDALTCRAEMPSQAGTSPGIPRLTDLSSYLRPGGVNGHRWGETTGQAVHRRCLPCRAEVPSQAPIGLGTSPGQQA